MFLVSTLMKEKKTGVLSDLASRAAAPQNIEYNSAGNLAPKAPLVDEP